MIPQATETRALPFPAEAKRSLTLSTMLRALRRHPIFLLLAVIVAGGAGTGVYLFLPPLKPVATAMFQIRAQPEAITLGDNRIQFEHYRNAQTNLIKSRLVLNNALNQPDVKDCSMIRKENDAITWLVNQLKVDFKAGPEMMTLTLEGDSMEEIKAIVTAVANSYMREARTKDKKDRVEEVERKSNSYRVIAEKLTGKRKAIYELSKEMATGDPQVAAAMEKNLIEQIGAYQKELGALDMEIILAKKQIEVFKKRIADQKEVPIPESQIEEMIKLTPGYQPLFQKLQAAQLALSDIKVAVAQSPGNPRVSAKERDVQLVNQQIKKYCDDLRPVVVEHLRNRAIEADKQNLNKLEQAVELDSMKLQEVNKRLEQFKTQEVQPFKARQTSLETLRQELTTSEKMAENLFQTLESIKPDLDSPLRVNVWQEPVAVAPQEGTRRIRYALISGVAMLVVCLGLVVGIDHRYRRVNGTQEVVSNLGLRVIGTVPAMPKNALTAGSSRGKSADEWHSLLTESMDSTRTILLHGMDSKESMRSILITSALSGEGKTSLASHLAVSLARAGYKTLLVDADMRRPMLHHVLNMNLSPGLSDLLRGELSLDDVIQPTPAPQLSLIAAGRFHPALPQILAGNAWRDLKTTLEAQFDYVIVDTPPLLPVADALLIARHVDGVLLALLNDVSRLGAVAEARDRLACVGTNILGVVVNGVSNLHYGNSYDYYYYHTNKV